MSKLKYSILPDEKTSLQLMVSWFRDSCIKCSHVVDALAVAVA